MNLPEIKYLKNGLCVLFLPYKGSQVVHCGLLIKAGTRDELTGKEGLAHFIEHSLFKGTSKRKSYHILNRLEVVGGELNAYTTKEETCIHASVMSRHFERAIELISDIVFNSEFPVREIEKEKEVIIDEIRSYQDTPYEQIFDDFEGQLFKGHSLGHPILGTEQSIRTFKRKDLIDYTKSLYNPATMIFVLNKKANKTEEQLYLLGNLPENSQWNYTLGGSYKKFNAHSFVTLVISRNQLFNQALKYKNNDDTQSANKILDYTSGEIENKFRLERTALHNSIKTNLGFSVEQSTYTNTTFNQLPTIGTIHYSSEISFLKYGLFGQVSKTFSQAGLVLSAGARTDANTFGKAMKNPLEQLSPRFSLSKSITDKITINANTGMFYQVPAYTILGYRDSNQQLTNEKVKYIRAIHMVLGLEYQNRKNGKITIEGFYKKYSHYPFGLQDSISIANQGSDFGVIGDEPVDSRSKGRAYGVEFLVQQKLYKGFYGLVAYTWVKSEFTNLNNDYTVSSWDFTHTISMTAGKSFRKNWEAGIKFRFNNGNPYTPYNVSLSSLKENWDISGQGVSDKTQINSRRTGLFHQLDFRLDKKYYFKKWSMDVYVDIQNIYNQVSYLAPYIDVVRDSNGALVVDPQDSSRYLVKEIKNKTGTLLPGIGLIIEL